MMRARVVIERVLDELESGQADLVEWEVIGAAGVGERDGLCAKIVERREPLFEDRRGCGVPLAIDAADLPAAIVEIEVRRQLLVFRAFDELRRAARGRIRRRRGGGLLGRGSADGARAA